MNYMITSDNAKIYYKDEGQGQPIILLHGFTANHEVFRVLQKLLSKNYMVIAYDLRGHGLSSCSNNITLDVLAKDLGELIEHLELKNVVLAGWSLGASIIFEYIKLFGCNNIKKLCILDSSPRIINDENWNLGIYHGNYYLENALNDIEKMKLSWDDYSKEFISRMAADINENQLKIAIELIKDNNKFAMIDIWKSLIYKDYRNMLKDIKVPTLLLFGGRSTLYSIEAGEYLKRNIKNSALIVFEKNTHLLVQENPIGINRALNDFIR